MSDVMMPGFDGIQLCRWMRSCAELRTTPILLVSALRKDAASALEGLAAGADEYIEVPFDPLMLTVKITHRIERHLAEQSIRESETKYRTLVEQASDGIFLFDKQGNLTEVNSKFSEMLRYTPDELCALNLADLMPAEDLAATPLLCDSLDKGEDVISQCRFRRQDETLVPMEISAKKLDDEKMQAIVRDITERLHAERQIQQLNEALERRVLERTAQLEQANRELDAFSYSVSHDLRAPLRFVSGFTELLTKRAASSLDETSLRYLQVISDSVKHAGALIDDLLAFSRMGRAEMRLSFIDTNQLIQDVRRDVEHEANGRELVWKIKELPVIQGDPSMMQLVFRNLLSNAVKYTRPRETAVIEIESIIKEHDIVFFVRDNGVGFDEKYSAKLFGVFERLHTTEEFEGTGIGLANVHRIVQRHGGPHGPKAN
ncbi:MAG: PAS domain S-box protein [Pyrinomonadaceae bacterium]